MFSWLATWPPRCRLGHSLRKLLETVDTLKAQEINLTSLDEDIDMSSAAGELVFHVFGAIAHFERQLTLVLRTLRLNSKAADHNI